jgi:hypothetical protein
MRQRVHHKRSVFQNLCPKYPRPSRMDRPSDFIDAWIGYCEEKGTSQTERFRSAYNEPAMNSALD